MNQTASPAPEREDWHALSAAEIAAALETDLERGLSAAEAQARLERYGPNRLPEQNAPGPLQLLLRQFASLLIYVLLAAAVLSLILGDILEFVAIILIAVLNGVLGFVQEYRAEQALNALQSLSAPSATAVRDGSPQRLPAESIVPGDILIIEAGDITPADARVIQASSLAAGEAMLTGESLPVDKSAAAVPVETPMAERASLLFQGTLVARGRAQAIAVRTGAATEMGRIAMHVAWQPRQETPLQRELAHVGRYLVIAAGALCFFVFIVGIARGIETNEMLLTAASLAVAAIPEGLPAASTVVLALGVQRMASRNAIVRRLSSVETLGSVTTVFTDKTGTLTQNSMRVEEMWTAGEEDDALRIALLCNNSSLNDDGAATGDPTEVALLEYVRRRRPEWSRQPSEMRELEVPFDAERARMTVVVRHGEERLALTKGATQRLLELSAAIGNGPVTEATRAEVADREREMASSGLRVLALAQRRLTNDETEPEAIERDLTLVGLIGMADPLRPEAQDAIATARSAGIRVIMLTGDQRDTAASIGRDLGLGGDVVAGADIDDLDPDRLWQRLDTASIFARVTSDNKLRIIEAARNAGQIVAMTGDGVNDAPALRAADIGIAMGAVGTDVAREASDMVLADDNFSTIVAAVEEGRSIHANIRRFIHFLLSCNTAEVIVVFLALVAAGQSALTPLQILFVNLLTDGLPALALGVEPASHAIMQQKPRPPGRGLLTLRSLTPIVGIGGLIAASSLIAYALGRSWGDHGLAVSLTFATLVGSQLASSFVFRAERETIFSLRPNPWLLGAVAASLLSVLVVFYVPLLQDAFESEPLAAKEWLAVAGLSLLPLLLGEAAKATGLLTRFGLVPESD